MATRMQQRRGTAAQWTSTNNGDGPVLEVGEIGFESDTGKFKIGDGINHWVDLDYFLDESDISGITGDYVLANTLGQANGVATLDGSGKLISSQVPNTLATTSYVDTAVSNLANSAPELLNTLNELAEAINDDPTFFTTVANNLSTHAADTTNVHGIADTAELATKEFAANLLVNASKTNITITGNKDGLTITAENGVADSTTSDLLEGTNLYFTNARAQAAVAADISSAINALSTTDIEEGTNQYFTNARVRAAVDGGTGLDYNSSTGVFDIDSTVTTNTGSQTLTNKSVDLANNTVTGTVAQFNSALSDANFITTTDTGTVTSAMIADEAIVNADISNTAAIAQSKIDGLTTDLAAKAALAGATFTGNVVVQQNLQVDGNFTVNGSNVLVSATQIQIEDSILQLAHENAANTVDLGLVAGYNDGSAKHAGLVKDVSDSGKWKLFKNVSDEPSTTVNFAQATLDDLVVGGLEATSLTLGNVTNTEFSYLDGVTSGIQGQIDSKISASSTDTLLNKTVNLANNTVIGTVAEFNSALSDANFVTTADTGTVTSTMILDGTIVNADINASAAIAQSKIANLTTDLSAKAPLASPTFTGTVTLPNTTSIGNVSSTELGYLDGITSNIQTQLNTKASLTGTETLSNKTLSSPTITTAGAPASLGSWSGSNLYGVDATSFIISTSYSNIQGATSITISNDGSYDGTYQVQSVVENYQYGAPGIILSNANIAGFNAANNATVEVFGPTVTTISSTEIGYLDGVTSNVQAQIDGKISASSTDTLLNKTVNLANNTVSGTIAQFNTALSDADFSTLAGTETLTNKTITGALNTTPILRSPEERWNVVASAATGTINFDALTSGILYYTTNASGNWTLNVRGDGSNTLNDMLAVNDSITVVFFATNGATPYYQTGFQIDGSSVTPKWQNGTAPTSGNANSIDVYSFTIVKTANATFTAFGSQTRFA